MECKQNKTVSFCVAMGLLSGMGYATANLINNDQQLIYQQERQKALEEQLNPEAPDISLLPDLPKTSLLSFPEESPCFLINKVTLAERDTLPWWIPLQKESLQAEGHCLGGQGIR